MSISYINLLTIEVYTCENYLIEKNIKSSLNNKKSI